MKERPILFSAPMIRALLDGRKTQTRRVVDMSRGHMLDHSPYGIRGDRLWVREALRGGRLSALRYDADGALVDGARGPSGWRRKWRKDCDEKIPSIHMPRFASRLTLELVSLHIEKVQEISDDDALAEGIDEYKTIPGGPRNEFARLWDSINGKRAPWASNPWIWVISFRRIEQGVTA